MQVKKKQRISITKHSSETKYRLFIHKNQVNYAKTWQTKRQSIIPSRERKKKQKM